MAETTYNGREIVINTLQQKLDVLKKNRENVPVEELKTKYSISYNRLLSEISEAYNAMVSRSMRGIKIDFAKTDEIQQIWNEQYKKDVSHAVYKDYDATKTHSLISEFANEVFCRFGEVA